MTTPTGPTARQRLLDAAADLFYRQGIGAVGVDLVSMRAGVSKRTLYQQFGSKDRLIAESLDAHGIPWPGEPRAGRNHRHVAIAFRHDRSIA